MYSFVPQDQWHIAFVGSSHAHCRAALINHLHGKFHGFRNSTYTRTGTWQERLYDTILAHGAGQPPVEFMNQAFCDWTVCADWPKAPLSGPIFSNDDNAIMAAEQALLAVLFPPKPEKLSKRQRKKKNRVARKVAGAAVQLREMNPFEFWDGDNMMEALPEVAEGHDEDMAGDDDDEEDEGVALPVSFGVLPMR